MPFLADSTARFKTGRFHFWVAEGNARGDIGRGGLSFCKLDRGTARRHSNQRQRHIPDTCKRASQENLPAGWGQGERSSHKLCVPILVFP